MVRKFRFIVFVTAAVLFIYGCDKKTEETEAGKGATLMAAGSRNVKLETNMGDIVVELNEEAAPVTVENFVRYVEEGFFDGTIFHRVISGFMVQGGGFTADMVQKQTHPPIANEAGNGLKNNRGTIAMGQLPGNPDSATSQFYVNLVDNNHLDYVPGRSPGYTVFGKVVEGMDVVDAIAAVKTTVRNGMPDVPVEPVVINSAKVALVKKD